LRGRKEENAMEISNEMIKGTVVPIILKLLVERPMYGYEIIKVVNERTHNAFEWKEGTLYPWLHRLEGDGIIRSEWSTGETGRRRKYYHVTRAGTAMLREKVAEWSAFSTAVNAVLLGSAV
jgi:PadR family transcriptional regulator, regulatory protein PadR